MMKYNFPPVPKPQTKWVWEQLDDWTKRARVQGGWLVKVEEPVSHIDMGNHSDGYDWRIALTFVPDVMGLWTFKQEVKDVT